MARLLAAVVVAASLLAVPARPADYNLFLKEIFPSGPGPSGSNNPVVPLNTTMAQLLQQSYASGLLTPEQVAAVKALKLGVYSYYWAIVGDPVQRVSISCLCLFVIVSRSPHSPSSASHFKGDATFFNLFYSYIAIEWNTLIIVVQWCASV